MRYDVATMKTMLLRLGIVLAGFLVLFEFIERMGVPRPESWSERAHIELFFWVIAGLIWASYCALRRMPGWSRVIGRGAIAAVFLAGFWCVGGFYSFTLRPNLGWYEEPHWVAQFEVFAKEHRARIEANLW